MHELALFAGAGGGLLAGRLLGWRTICAVELDGYAREVLLARQRDGSVGTFPVWDDVRTFDGHPWRGIIDIISGGFPCQDISVAGRGEGIDGERSGLWGDMYRVVCEVRPRLVFVENSPMLLARGLGRVLGDLAAAGYDACWCVLGADDLGAPHVRKRLWLLAHDADADVQRSAELDSEHEGAAQSAGGSADGLEARGDVADADVSGCQEQRRAGADEAKHTAAECADWWEAEPGVGRMADGVASCVDRLRALGNGWVPVVAAEAYIRLARALGVEL